MDIRPILSTLRRHKTAAALIVLETALTCAIVCNAVFLLGSRLELMATPTGLAESELLYLRLSSSERVANADALTLQDLATLRALPGVKDAASMNQVPFGHSSSDTGINLAPEQPAPTVTASFYIVGEHTLSTMGVHIVEGRDFEPAEFRPQSAVESDPNLQVPSVMLTRATATRLFPDRSAIGQALYLFGDRPSRVIGIVDHLTPPRPLDPRNGDHVLIVPVRPAYDQGSYLVRVADSTQRAAVLKSAVAALEALDTRRTVVNQQLFDELRSEYYDQDLWMAGLLVAVCVALLVVTAFGIVGLASFWVQQRTRMIGIRRALGASSGQILRYFQLENFLLTSLGIALGMAGAYGINQLLMVFYETPRLPATMLPWGALALWVLGQVAVLAPARRAAALPPVVVMRGA